MTKYKVWKTIAWISFTASGAMFILGTTDGKLTELRDLFFVPLLPGFIALALAGKPEEAEPTAAAEPVAESSQFALSDDPENQYLDSSD